MATRFVGIAITGNCRGVACDARTDVNATDLMRASPFGLSSCSKASKAPAMFVSVKSVEACECFYIR